ncbi:MAG: HAMP domain-containing protein, partial [Chloroflexota bacterium]
MSNTSPPERRASRFLPYAIFIIIAIFLFVSGGTAVLYLIFSKYSGVTNIWLLVCGAPFILIVLAIFTIVRLYTRFGKPLEQLFNAINSIEEGDFSVRVPENNSDMFSNLIKRFNKMIGELERAE